MGDAELIMQPGFIEIELAKLHHRYIPKITPLDLYPGADPMLFSKSHHVSLLRTIIKHGLDWGRLKKHPYYVERQHRYNIGITNWTNSRIQEHIAHRWDTYRSLKNKGYDKKLGDAKPIVVLERPLWETRFGWESGFLSGPEIYDGAGRCAAAIVLGWDKIRVAMATDAKPGTCEAGKYLGKIKK